MTTGPKDMSAAWASGWPAMPLTRKTRRGRPLLDETFLMLLNAHHEPRPFTLPAHKRGVRWQPVLDTALYDTNGKPVVLLRGGEQYDLEARSLAVLRLRPKT